MTQFTFANNVNTTLAAAATSSSTTLTLASSNHMPSSIPSGEYLALTLNDAATRSVFEIVYATSISGATVTVIRGQEGTTAQNWQVGDYIYASNTAGILSSFAPVEGSTNNPFAVAPASSSAPQNAPQYGQMFQLLRPSASENITLTALRTIVTPIATSPITLTMQPGTVIGQECQIIGTPYGVTVQSTVSSGAPTFDFPDISNGYSFTLSTWGATLILVWDGINWRARTFGQMVVGTPAAQNQAAPLSYLQANFAAINGSSDENFNADILYAQNAQLYGIFDQSNNSALVLNSNYTASVNYANNALIPHQCAPAANNAEVVTLGQFSYSFSSAPYMITERPDSVIEQWFTANVTTGGSGSYSFSINYPEAFPYGAFGAVVGFRNSVPVPASVGYASTSATTIIVLVDSDAAQTVNIAIAVIGH